MATVKDLVEDWIEIRSIFQRQLEMLESGQVHTGTRISDTMTKETIVRIKSWIGEEEFLNAHRNDQADWPGLKKVNMIKSGDRSYCIIGEWADMIDLVAARPNMIATLDPFRDTLEDLGGGLGVTDPASGPVVLELK